MVLVQKWPFFKLFFFWEYRQRKCLLRYSRTKKGLFSAIKTRSSKTQTIDIFPQGVNPWFWSKDGHFSNFFFQAIQARKMSFTLFQNKKSPFQAIKTRTSKSGKIDIFHAFGPKMAVFATSYFFFFLGSIGQEIVFYDIVERKNAYIGYKNQKFKKSKN